MAGGGGGAAYGGGRGGPPEGDRAADENPALRLGGAGHHARGHRRYGSVVHSYRLACKWRSWWSIGSITVDLRLLMIE